MDSLHYTLFRLVISRSGVAGGYLSHQASQRGEPFEYLVLKRIFSKALDLFLILKSDLQLRNICLESDVVDKGCIYKTPIYVSIANQEVRKSFELEYRFDFSAIGV